MELLLLLSALLTALTGAITGVRPAHAAAQEQMVAAADREVVAARVATTPLRMVQGWPALARVVASVGQPLTIVARGPSFGQRRRE